MAYTPIPAADVVAGKPTKQEIFTRIRSNQEQFATDIENLKQTSLIDMFNIKFAGSTSDYATSEITKLIPAFQSPVSGSIVNFVVTLLTPSTSGSLQIDIERSSDNGVNWVPLLDNPVTLSGTTVGSISGTVDWIDASSQVISINDLFRITVTGIQVNQGNFHVSIYGEIA